MTDLNFNKINELSEKYKADMTKFLRDMIRIPSESCQEKEVVHRIKEEMEKVGFDKVEFDGMGNVIGYVGTGKRLIAFDAHIDTVGIGNRANWTFDPYEGMEDDEVIGGRGASDQEGGRHGLHGLRRQNHQGTGPGQRLHRGLRRFGAGRGLRRPLLAVSH